VKFSKIHKRNRIQRPHSESRKIHWERIHLNASGVCKKRKYVRDKAESVWKTSSFRFNLLDKNSDSLLREKASHKLFLKAKKVAG
jgi:hypothetical protein